MWQMRQAGATLEVIGQAFGIRKQLVSRRLIKHYGTTKVQGLLRKIELLELTSSSPPYLNKLKLGGVIKPAQVPGRKKLLWPQQSLKQVLDYKVSHPRHCRMCGRPRPSERSVYCSDGCEIEGHKIKNRPLEVRERHYERMRDYQRMRRKKEGLSLKDS